MDQGPFRMSRPAGASAAGGDRTAAARRPAEPQPVAEAPKPPQRVASAYHKEEKPKKKLVVALAGVLILIVIVIGGWLLWSKLAGGGVGIDKSKYQAIFFTNGQVYFGKLKPMGGSYFTLTDIYYLQASQEQQNESADQKNPQETSSDQNANVQLIKLGNEIHGPQDEMIISRDQVLFFENLKPDGKVAQSIEEYKKPH